MVVCKNTLKIIDVVDTKRITWKLSFIQKRIQQHFKDRNTSFACAIFCTLTTVNGGRKQRDSILLYGGDQL